MLRRPFATLLALAGALSCAPDFEPASTLSTLRVLAVQKDKPYARPGDTVTLRMLIDDASDEAPRPVQIVWLGGVCENPLGDSYLGCFANPNRDTSGPYGLPKNVATGVGPVFSLELSRTIISGRPRPANPKQTPYGVSYVFFAVCAGTVDVAPEALPPTPDKPNPDYNPTAFPIACFSPSGKRVDASGFVAGYTEVFAYDKLTNENPIVTGFEIDGQAVTPECIGAACIDDPSATPGSDGGRTPRSIDGGRTPRSIDGGGLDAAGEGGPDAAPAPAGPSGAGGAPSKAPSAPIDPCQSDSPACIEVCTKEKQDDCPKHSIKLIVDPASVEHDGVAEAIESATVLEHMWVNHYTDSGKIPREVKLLADSTLGYRDNHGTDLLAPKKKGVFHVWAVAHDNRGGAQWVRVRMAARDPL